MDCTIREVRPDELPDAVEPGAVTLVLGAPAVGKSHYTRGLGSVVTHLSEITTVADDEPVIVDDFVSAVLDLGTEGWSVHRNGPGDWTRDGSGQREWDAFGERSLFGRPGATVLVTRPRSLDWLCQYAPAIAGDVTAAVDAVLVVRTPPAAATEAIDEIRSVIASQSVQPLGDEERQRVLDRSTSPAYHFENSTLQQRLGRYEASVTPAAFLSLSRHDDAAVLVAADVRRALADRDVSVGPLDEDVLATVTDLIPRGGLASRIPGDDSPAVRTAVLLVAVALATDGDWLAPFVEYRPLAGAAETLEIELDVPPGTITFLRLFAGDTPRARIRDRLAEIGSPVAMEDADLDAVGTAMSALGAALESVAWTPDEYGSFPLVGAWHAEGPAALEAAAAERIVPGSDADPAGNDGLAGVDVDDLVEALDGGLVVLSGPAGRGKRRLAASAATELGAWGATVELPDLRRPDHSRSFVDATPDAVVVATYGAEPARIVSDAGVRALVDWVDDGVCAGALLICDDANREQFETVCERAGCPTRPAWHDRVEFSLDGPNDDPDRDPAALARDLLDAMGWPETSSPSRWRMDVEPVTDQSPLAVIAGTPDADLDAAFLGRVFAEAVAIVAETHHPDAARQWLSLADDLLADVARNRCDTDGVVAFRGIVYGVAMAAVATEQPTTDEWVAAIADCAVDRTNETATPRGQESVGGDREPVVSAFGIALQTLARPADGTGPNHGALACVDQVLHSIVDTEAVTEEPGLTLCSRIYGEATARIVERVDDPVVADDALGPVAALVQQAAATNDDTVAAFVMGNSFASMLGAVAGAARSPDDLTTWVDALGSRIRESLAFVQRQPDRAELVRNAYAGAIGFWGFEFACPADRIEPWLVALGADCCRTVAATDRDDPAAFVVELYGQAVWHVVGYRDFERAEQLFEVCHSLVETIASALAAADERDLSVALHAEALAAFATIEYDDADGGKGSSHGAGALPFPGATDFEDWIERYDAAVRAAATTADTQRERERFLTAVYRGALSTHVYGFAGESTAGISPRQERVWFAALTEHVETVAASAELVDDPITFLGGVYGDAAVRWASEGATTRAGEWIDSLVSTFRACRWEIDGFDTADWFDAFASADAALLKAVVTRPNGGGRTHERLREAAFSRIEAGATAADNPPHPVNYVSNVFGTALALAVDAEPAEVRFAVTEVLTAAEDGMSLDWMGIERADIFERLYGEALATVGRTRAAHSNTDEWLAVVTDRIEATAIREVPDDPAAFVASVYTRAYVDGLGDGVAEWRRRLDSELRTFAAGAHVEDTEGFLTGVYADIVVAGTTTGQPAAEVEACVEAVSRSVAAASEAGLAGTDDPVVRTFSRAADTLRRENPHARADHTYLLGRALSAVGGDALEAAVFDASGETGP